MTLYDKRHTPYNLDYAALYGVPVEQVDEAISLALEVASAEDGWSGIPELNPLIWNRIGSHVEHQLDYLRKDAA